MTIDGEKFLGVGAPSWCIDINHPEEELIAAIARGEIGGEYEWTNTYTRNHRNHSNIVRNMQAAFAAA